MTYIVNLPAKDLVNKLKLLANTDKTEVDFKLTNNCFCFGTNLVFYYYQNKDYVKFNETINLSISSDSLLKAKSLTAVKGEAYFIFDVENKCAALYLEASNLGFELAIVETGISNELIDSGHSSDLILLSSYNLLQISNLSQVYKKVYFTNKYLIGFDDINCGFAEVNLTDKTFCYELEVKSTLINGLNKVTDLFFCKLTDACLVISDDLEQPSFSFDLGTYTELGKFQSLVITSISNSKEKGEIVNLGSGKYVKDVVSNAKKLYRIIRITESGELQYYENDEFTTFSSLNLSLSYPLCLNTSIFEKILKPFFKSQEVKLFYIDSFNPIFVTDEKELHYETMVPYFSI